MGTWRLSESSLPSIAISLPTPAMIRSMALILAGCGLSRLDGRSVGRSWIGACKGAAVQPLTDAGIVVSISTGLRHP